MHTTNIGGLDGYHIQICSCADGPSLGARRAGAPCRCERCGLITQDQLDSILAQYADDKEPVWAWIKCPVCSMKSAYRGEYVGSAPLTCTNPDCASNWPTSSRVETLAEERGLDPNRVNRGGMVVAEFLRSEQEGTAAIAIDILAAAHRAADVLDAWDGDASSSLGGCSPGGAVRYEVHEAVGLDVDTCPICSPMDGRRG